MSNKAFEKYDSSSNKVAVAERIKEITANSFGDIFIIDRALGEKKYNYERFPILILLIPGHRPFIINCDEDNDILESFMEDFIEDMGYLSDKFEYKDIIGRPRVWRNSLICQIKDGHSFDLEIINQNRIDEISLRRGSDLLISLLTGCINSAARIGTTSPETVIDKIKKKIILFDGDQTRFIYEILQEGYGKSTKIQGLSGTGKTELLLHRLKELYLISDDSRIVVTCHNKILAASLKERIPAFFNFMRVEKQIKWDERLWCMNAWGSERSENSGTYRRIVSFYGVPFYSYSRGNTFGIVCKNAIDAIKACKKFEEGERPFDYILIDESQDFPDEFIDLCKICAKKHTIIAGDIFQSIFDENIVRDTKPDHLLSKCYRTDPRTLMFSHAMGMGLFENPKIRWLRDDEWAACGYNIEKSGNSYTMTRELIRRFEDISDLGSSIEIHEYENSNMGDLVDKVSNIITTLKVKYPDICADDIGVIFIDSNKNFYRFADLLCVKLFEEHQFKSNKAYETKNPIPDTVLISNQNNVKGLEYPFIICIAGVITERLGLRNSLYMMLTRSFISTHLLLSGANSKSLRESTRNALKGINESNSLHLIAPSEEEQQRLNATIKMENVRRSIDEVLVQMFDELLVIQKARPILIGRIKRFLDDEDQEFNYETVKDFTKLAYRGMRKVNEGI